MAGSNGQHTRSHQGHWHGSTSIKDSRINNAQSNVSTRTKNEVVHPKLSQVRGDTTTTASRHTAKSWEHHPKERKGQSLPITSYDIAFDLGGLTLNSESSNSLTAAMSIRYCEPHDTEAEIFSKHDYHQSSSLSSGDMSYTYPSSTTLSSKNDLIPIGRYLEEGVEERYSIFSIEYDESSLDPYGNIGSESGGELMMKGPWRYS